MSLAETVRNIGGCTVGLVGYGNTAKRVEAAVAAMGARVLHTSTSNDGHPAWRALAELMASSDIVSLLGLDNVVLMPHVSWSTVDTVRRYVTEAIDKCRRLRDGLPLANTVNSAPIKASGAWRSYQVSGP